MTRHRDTVRLAVALLVLAAGAAALTLLVASGGGSAQATYVPPAGLPIEDVPTAPGPSAAAPVVAKPLRVPRASKRAGGARTQAVVLPHSSRAIGAPNDGRLQGGVLLPAAGRDFFTWNLPLGIAPNPDWRRVGTDTLVTWLQGVLRYFRARYPQAPRIGIADLSLPQGGPFGPQYGGLGHASHQNGLDVDVLYPRVDRAERVAATPAEVDRPLSQALVDTFVAAGARFCFVGEHLGLTGPAGIVQVLAHHDDHVHVRIDPLPA